MCTGPIIKLPDLASPSLGMQKSPVSSNLDPSYEALN